MAVPNILINRLRMWNLILLREGLFPPGLPEISSFLRASNMSFSLCVCRDSHGTRKNGIMLHVDVCLIE